MTGETDLRVLLASMHPRLLDEEYVFCSFQDANYGDFAELQPVASRAEPEGMTLVIPKSNADECGLDYQSVFRCITLDVHSSLDAVGLTAAVSNELMARGISANMIAGFYHDHIFVQSEYAHDAQRALHQLSAHAQSGKHS